MQQVILIVDDEPDFVTVLRTRLESQHYAVAVAFDGEEGLRIARAKRPALILLDIGMPRMDGYTFIRSCKEDPLLGKIPIIVLTGKGAQMQDLFLQEGVAAYFEKSVDPAVLLRAIRKELPGPSLQEGG